MWTNNDTVFHKMKNAKNIQVKPLNINIVFFLNTLEFRKKYIKFQESQTVETLFGKKRDRYRLNQIKLVKVML